MTDMELTLRKHAGMLQALALLAKGLDQKAIPLDRELAVIVAHDLQTIANRLRDAEGVLHQLPGA